MKTFTGLLFIFVFSGCISTTQQTDSLLNSAYKENQKSIRIEGVAFIDQAAGQCGPATLTMALNFQGKKIQVDEVSSQVYTPGMKGTLQTDIITATRRQGLMAIPIDNLESLLKEVRAGHPVIVFENLALSWWPQWHYALVFGYDLSRKTILMHSGPEENKEWDLRKFERSWKLGDYWGLVVLSPEKLSASGNELTHANAAVGLELTGKKEEALIAFQTMLTLWPNSLTALIGLGNLAFEKKNYTESIRYLKKATKKHPTSAPARHNLLVAQSAARQK